MRPCWMVVPETTHAPMPAVAGRFIAHGSVTLGKQPPGNPVQSGNANIHNEGFGSCTNPHALVHATVNCVTVAARCLATPADTGQNDYGMNIDAYKGFDAWTFFGGAGYMK